MTVTINISPDALQSLTERATARGTDLEGYVQDLIEKDVQPQRRISEILAPFRQEVQSRGVTDSQLDSLFEEALSDVRRDKRAE
ncbi:MAG: hypothetical protein IAF94_15020 [Pirellulaceae bacterium]|nr:hypothetical protein [Pirellulaceae bacterium]